MRAGISLRCAEAGIIKPPPAVSGKIDPAVASFPHFGVDLRLRPHTQSAFTAEPGQVANVNHLIGLGIIKDQVSVAPMAGKAHVHLAVTRHFQGRPIPVHLRKS